MQIEIQKVKSTFPEAALAPPVSITLNWDGIPFSCTKKSCCHKYKKRGKKRCKKCPNVN